MLLAGASETFGPQMCTVRRVLGDDQVRFACAAEALSVEPGLGAEVAGQVHIAAAVDRDRVRRVVLATAEDFRPQVASARCVERQEYVPPLHGS